MDTAIGMNIYGGGFTIGASRVFKVLGQWEEIDLGAKTFDHNFKNIPHPLELNDWPVCDFTGVPYVYANPPCAPWSSANTRAGHTKDKRFEDPRLELTRHTMETGMKLRPEVFISESVENAYNFGQEYYKQYVKKWMKLGYSVTWFLTDAILHGLPSMRRRFHFIAHKKALQLKAPVISSFKPVTVRDSIFEINNQFDEAWLHMPLGEHGRKRAGAVTENSLAVRMMKATPFGGKLRETERTWKNYHGPYSSFLVKRLMWDSTAFTMVGLSKLIHPEGHRLLTWREGLRLMSFPDDFYPLKEVDAADSVTPLMGEYLSRIAAATIKRGEQQQPAFNVVDWRALAKPYHIAVLKHVKGLE